MTPGQLIAWFKTAAPGEKNVYWGNRWRTCPPEVFHTAKQLAKEGRALLYQKHGVHCIQKLSTRSARFVALVSASVKAPPMGPFGRYAAGIGGDPGPWID